MFTILDFSALLMSVIWILAKLLFKLLFLLRKQTKGDPKTKF